MDAVEDDRDDDVVARERRADDARVAVQERAHRVEEMRDAARAAVERRVRLRGGRVGVAERDGDAALEQPVDQRRPRPASSGASVISRTGPASSRRSSSAEVGVAPRRGLVRARAGSARGTAPRGARRGCAGASRRRPAPRASAASSCSSGRRDQRRQVRGDARLEQRLAGAPVAVRVGVEEVDAAEAVHLQVDEAGHGDARGRRRLRARQRDDAAVARPRRRPGRARPSTSAASTPSLIGHLAHRASLEVVRASGQYQFRSRIGLVSGRSWSIPSAPQWRRSALEQVTQGLRRRRRRSTTSRSRSPTASSSCSSARPAAASRRSCG